MEKLTSNYAANAAELDLLLGVGRSCDMVSRDYVIGGGRGCGWWTVSAATASLSAWAPSG